MIFVKLQQDKTIYYKKTYKPFVRRPRLNHQIKTNPIRLIDEKGNNLDIVKTGDALKMAFDRGLDLIEIAPNANPPVCRIMDFGKYQYQKSQVEKKQKTKQKKIDIKGIRISFGISQHDAEFKAKQAEKFLSQGHKVRIEMILRGREKGMFEIAQNKMKEFIDLIPFEIKIEQSAKRQQRGLGMVIVKE
ncbi:MAG: translation initiation factor IF-3 [Patescibacteria group bacterium]|nr:translation initiation factor IF-3 [Patescibacteria group bacterium]